MITLAEVDRRNWTDCINLSLSPEQGMQLAPNVVTIAESKFEPHYILRAICSDSTVVGMLAYCQEVDEPTPDVYWLFRLMIDHREQRKGYASQAVELACNEMASLGAATVKTMHRPGNGVASRLYESRGFHVVGKLDDGDVVLARHLGNEQTGPRYRL